MTAVKIIALFFLSGVLIVAHVVLAIYLKRSIALLRAIRNRQHESEEKAKAAEKRLVEAQMKHLQVLAHLVYDRNLASTLRTRYWHRGPKVLA